MDNKNVLPQQVTYNRLIQYLQDLKSKAQSTRYRVLQLNGIRLYFDYLLSSQQIAHNPATGLYIRGITRHLPHQYHSVEQLKAIFTDYVTHDTEQGNDLHQMIGFIVFQGLRPREIARLTLQDIDLVKAIVFVTGDKRTASRTLPLESVQLLSMQKYLAKRGQKEGELFEAKTFHAKRLKVEAYLKKSGVLKLQHIRASVISIWVKQYHLREAQYRAGHKYVSSTEKYLHSQPETLQKAVKAFHPLNPNE